MPHSYAPLSHFWQYIASLELFQDVFAGGFGTNNAELGREGCSKGERPTVAKDGVTVAVANGTSSRREEEEKGGMGGGSAVAKNTSHSTAARHAEKNPGQGHTHSPAPTTKVVDSVFENTSHTSHTSHTSSRAMRHGLADGSEEVGPGLGGVSGGSQGLRAGSGEGELSKKGGKEWGSLERDGSGWGARGAGKTSSIYIHIYTYICVIYAYTYIYKNLHFLNSTRKCCGRVHSKADDSSQKQQLLIFACQTRRP